MSSDTTMAGGPPIKIGSEWRPAGRGPHDDLEVRVAYSLRHAETLCGFLAGVELTQFSLFKRSYGWLLMLKGKRGRKELVAFRPATTFPGALVLAATSLDSGDVPWQADKPKPKG